MFSNIYIHTYIYTNLIRKYTYIYILTHLHSYVVVFEKNTFFLVQLKEKYLLNKCLYVRIYYLHMFVHHGQMVSKDMDEYHWILHLASNVQAKISELLRNILLI
jgi:hypothetical protein